MIKKKLNTDRFVFQKPNLNTLSMLYFIGITVKIKEGDECRTSALDSSIAFYATGLNLIPRSAHALQGLLGVMDEHKAKNKFWAPIIVYQKS